MATFKKDIPLSQVNDSVLDGLKVQHRSYFIWLLLLGLIIGWGVILWIFQVKTGMVVTGLNHPVGWGTYITSFVFWIGIAHSGTLISAILYLMRSQWRDAVSRSTEAMTVFAVMTAGMFPLVHLGRVWVFFFLLPYPNQRFLYPNYMSPLVWDLIAVMTYFTVSVIFFYVGLIPDAAAARDRYQESHGENHWRTKFFKALSLGWSGSLNEWRHYGRSYLLFALLATPLVVSVHSIVSWDFAASLLPGWHSTIFAPYFVAGAIHSGLAMALTLLIPMRKFLHLKDLITNKHLEIVAKTIIVTTSIITYTYIIEPLIEYYSGNKFNVQFTNWRFNGYLVWIYYLFIVFNVFVPLTFAFKKARRNITWLFIASICINVGMWFERYYIVTGSTAHDFMPHNWGAYTPWFVEISILTGLICFFFFLFTAFTKLLPTVTISEFKEFLTREKLPEPQPCKLKVEKVNFSGKDIKRKLYIFSTPGQLISAVKSLCDHNFRNIDIFSPFKLIEIQKILGVTKSPVGYWTLAGGIFGLLSGIYLTVGSVEIYNIVIGGKPAVSIIPYVPIMFELTILGASLVDLVVVIFYTGLYKTKIKPYYDRRFSRDKFGLLVSYDKMMEEDLESIVKNFNPEEEHDKN